MSGGPRANADLVCYRVFAKRDGPGLASIAPIIAAPDEEDATARFAYLFPHAQWRLVGVRRLHPMSIHDAGGSHTGQDVGTTDEERLAFLVEIRDSNENPPVETGELRNALLDDLDVIRRRNRERRSAAADARELPVASMSALDEVAPSYLEEAT